MPETIFLTGKAIQVGRALRGMTQRELAEASGLPVWRVWSLEHGVKPPKPDELAKILMALTSE